MNKTVHLITKLILGTLYVSYIAFFFNSGGFNWRIFSVILLVVFPIYMGLFLRQLNDFKKKEIIAMSSPLILWALLTLVVFRDGKSAANFFLIEPEIIVLISGFYLFRNEIVRLLQINKNIVICLILVVEYFIVFCVAKFIPTIGN